MQKIYYLHILLTFSKKAVWQSNTQERSFYLELEALVEDVNVVGVDTLELDEVEVELLTLELDEVEVELLTLELDESEVELLELELDDCLLYTSDAADE